MSVFHWTKLLGARSQVLHRQVQKEFILSGKPWQMLSALPDNGRCPSSSRAKLPEKKDDLDGLFRLIEISKAFLKPAAYALEKLHAHFLKNIESHQLILTGRNMAQLAQQSMGRLLF
ncbi:MAG: hypothetical protein ACREBW_05825 [Candidatus Micrarchaeaceae archaeon]